MVSTQAITSSCATSVLVLYSKLHPSNLPSIEWVILPRFFTGFLGLRHFPVFVLFPTLTTISSYSTRLLSGSSGSVSFVRILIEYRPGCG